MRIALNFGPNKDTPPERVVEDYAALTRRLARFADFIVVNLSSPNTPGLREWQAPERIRAIVEAVRTAMPSTVPAELTTMTPAAASADSGERSHPISIIAGTRSLRRGAGITSTASSRPTPR